MTNDQAGFEGKPIGRIEKGENQVNKGMNLEKIEALVLFTVMALMVFLTGPAKVNADCVGSNTTFEFGDTVTESCTFDSDTLRSDTPGATGHGLIIGAPGITIDGNGFCLDGEVKTCDDPMNPQYGIHNWNKHNVTIKDLEIKNFCTGIRLEELNENLIDCCDIHDNGDQTATGARDAGIWQEGVAYTTISNCKIHHNEADQAVGGPPAGHGIYLCTIQNDYDTGNVWTGNEIYENIRAGAFFRCMPIATEVSHNYVHNNGWSGFRAQCVNCQSGTFKYNYVTQNGTFGADYYSDGTASGITIGGQAANPNTACYNVCTDNQGYGMEWIRSAKFGCMYENTLCGNTLYDLRIWPASGIAVIDGACNVYNTELIKPMSSGPGADWACGAEPCADYSHEQTTALTIAFTDLSAPGNQSDPVDSWYWDFGDCSAPSTEQNPTHVYSEPGNYMVCLSVNDANVCGTAPCDSGYNLPCTGTEGRRDTVCQEVTVMGYYLDLSEFPWYQSELPAEKYSGPAVARMWLSYLWWDDTLYPGGPPDLCDNTKYPHSECTQDQLYGYGHPENYSCNSGLELLDARGLWYTVQYLDPPWSPYHYNFGIYKRDDVNTALNDICHWIAYPAGREEGHPVHVPAAVPTGGDYDNWMAVRGIHTSVNPYENSSYEIYGFWLNDPNPGGIGANIFTATNQFTGEYFLQMDVNVTDPCDNKWVSILEPPDHYAVARIVRPKARFKKAIRPVMMEKAVLLDGSENMVLVKKIEEDESLDVVQAAIDGVSEHLIPIDPLFAEAFDKTVPGEPLAVSDDSGDYYLVPFDLPFEMKPIPTKPVPMIQKLDKLAGVATLVKREYDELVIEPINIDPIEVDEERTLVVVLVDAEDGSFKETSWVQDPVKYLPVSIKEALKLVLAETGPSNTRPVIELVHMDSSPYYPAWMITVNGTVYIVSQDGTVSQ